jgi:predicted metal-dependent peptidase
MQFDPDDFRQISRALERHEGIFAKLWQIGRPIFDDSVGTACVTFNSAGQFISFHFNPKFWEELDLAGRCFIICHECLHIILNHGMRMMGMNRSIANTTEDIVINELLVKKMGFSREDLPVKTDENGEKIEYCWFDTVFTSKNGFAPDFLDTLDKDQNFEYYYDLFKDKLKEQLEKALKSGNLVLVDSHESMEGQDMSDILEEVLNGVSKEELESFKDKLQKGTKKELQKSEDSKEKQSKNQKAGSGTGSLIKTIEKRKIIKKKKWETIINKWWKKMLKETEKEIYTFKRKNRRYEYLNSEFLLPALLEEDEIDREKSKIDVLFFLDVSGSVSGLETRFFNAAKSVPSDRFNVELFTFDTQVRKIPKGSYSLHIGGGTCFKCISDYVYQNYYNKGKEKVFCWVISDGIGSDYNLDLKFII